MAGWLAGQCPKESEMCFFIAVGLVGNLTENICWGRLRLINVLPLEVHLQWDNNSELIDWPLSIDEVHIWSAGYYRLDCSLLGDINVTLEGTSMWRQVIVNWKAPTIDSNLLPMDFEKISQPRRTSCWGPPAARNVDRTPTLIVQISFVSPWFRFLFSTASPLRMRFQANKMPYWALPPITGKWVSGVVSWGHSFYVSVASLGFCTLNNLSIAPRASIKFIQWSYLGIFIISTTSQGGDHYVTLSFSGRWGQGRGGGNPWWSNRGSY